MGANQPKAIREYSSVMYSHGPTPEQKDLSVSITQEPIKYLEYRVKPGDTLSYILAQFYDAGFGSNEYKRRVADIIELIL